MKILQRYVLSELILPFILCFLTLNFIFMGGYLVKAANFIIGRSVPLLDTLYVLVLALPDMISYTVPTSLLTAVLIVFGGFSQNNEIRAMKASGIHAVHIMLPALMVGLAASLVMFVFNDQVATNARFELRKATKKMLIKHPMAIIEPGRFVKLDEGITFLAKQLDGRKMRDIVAYENEGGDKPVRTIIAERGEIVVSPEETEMQIRLYDGSISDTEDASVQSIQFETYEFPSLGQEDIRNMQKKKRDLTLAEILVNLEAGYNSDEDERELTGAFHQRIAFSLGSFIFAFMGIPIAMIVRRGEIIFSFAIAMGAACIYYILFVGAKTVAVHGIVPDLAAFWVPNILLMLLATHLCRISIRT